MTVPDAIISNASMTYTPPDWPGGYWWHWVFFTVMLIGFMLTMVIIAIYVERRGMGRMQSRLGPNRTGPFGIFQMIADVIKILLKEGIVPDKADKVVHWLAPIIAFVPVALIFAVIPFQPGAMLADLNIGILFIVAVSSLTTLGVFMAGWGSSNKYSLLGAMRNVAAVVSYEIPLALSIVGTLLVAGTMSLNGIVTVQDIPFILVQPLGFLIFFIAGCAEINRSPFDLMEADSELVAGFHTEYSGMKFAMFYLVEYAEAIAISAIVTCLFLAGWRGPFLPGWLWFIIKTLFVFFCMVWVRTTFPRVRIDQLMALAWKFLLPLSLINLFITAIQVLSWDNAINWIAVVVNIVVMLVLILVWSKFFKLGWGRLEV